MFRKKSKKIYYWLIAFILLIIVLFYSAWVINSLLWSLAEVAEQSSQFFNSYQQLTITQKQERVEIINHNLQAMRGQAKSLFYLAYLPGLRQVYFAVDDSLMRVERITGNIQLLFTEYADFIDQQDTTNLLSAYLAKHGQESFIGSLNKAATIMAEIEDDFSGTRQNIISLQNHLLLINYRQQLTGLAEGLENMVKVTAGSKEVLLLAPVFLSNEQEKTFLLLFQNNNEMRPTGGFWGSYGILTLTNGKITKLFTDDIYHLDSQVIGKLEIEPPAPIKKYLNVKYWYLRDANWSPDFPTSAQSALRFYRLEGGTEKIDGVIAITPNVISGLLSVAGSLIVEGVNYGADNFLSTLQFEVDKNYSTRGSNQWDRKDIIGQLAGRLVERMWQLDLKQLALAASSLHENLQNKDIIFYFPTDQYQQLALRNNWSGELRSSSADYLMVVDSNMAAYKSNQYVNRSIDYEVQKKVIGNDQFYYLATVKIKYQHQGSFSWDSTRYRTYTRIYVPQGAILNYWSGAMENDRSTKPGAIDVGQEFGKTYFGAFISIEPGQSGELVFSYRLPAYYSPYHLLYQKQPGSKDNLRIRINQENWQDYSVNTDLVIK
ncbi:MAG: hypothetical protein COX77_03690 [Candidatus Komeilibacteria bacterium CG_4_10_14_0_2_um_filter_37_10]|uniref:DUF4012 domain-containing protein n=1 Tax=Candidatus Komeilibacteria bacterium CG_4_10_14_0_2_um_filter_37_10 TaxID=1974470 RepID=A0A2M7VDY8_9BACT|nr:MAG: hypothetical protein COX77_03690 [Candidatus Komeilibacteria bacterium CG_4_10_14_0_2_um_filter_37_10]